MSFTPVMQYTAAAIFGLALLHTFSTKYFLELAHKSQLKI